MKSIFTIDEFIHPDLLNGNILKSMVFFTLPLLVSSVFQQLYNSADTVIIGHFLGETSLAAIGACVAIYDLLIGFGIGFGNGLSVVAARAFGAADEVRLKKVTAASVVITLFISLVIFLFSFFCLKPLMLALGTPAEIIDEAYSYISMITKYAGILFAYNLFAGMLRAIGNSFVPLLFLIFSSCFNIFLDVILITKFKMGIHGAAVATVCAQFLSAVFCLFYIFRKAKILLPQKIHFAFEKKLYLDLLGQGLSMALMYALVQSGTVILQKAINGFGTYIIAGQITSRKIFALTNLPIMTLGIASATFTSQNLGANRLQRIRKGVNYSIFITLVWTFFLIVFSPLIVNNLVPFISGSKNPEILSYSRKYLYMIIPFHLILGGLIITRNSLQGLGTKILPLISSVIELLGKILFVIFIIPRLGTWGIILCEPLIWVAMYAHLFYAYNTHPIIRKSRGSK